MQTYESAKVLDASVDAREYLERCIDREVPVTMRLAQQVMARLRQTYNLNGAEEQATERNFARAIADRLGELQKGV